MTLRARVKSKWRPRLGLVVFAVLLTVLTLPIVVVIWSRALDGTTNQMQPTEIGALVVALVLTLVVAFVLTRTITGPIEALVRRAEEIGRGGRAAILPLDRYGTREIATLSQSFLDLADRLVERTDYMQSFAAHVSHELKSPLTAIKGAAELLRDEQDGAPMSAAERQRFLDHIVADVDRSTALLARLRELAQAELPAVTGRTDASSVAADLAQRFPELTIMLTGERDLLLGLPTDAASAVFGHLAENATEHGARRLEITAAADGGMASIVVADDGSGIPAGNKALVLQPFFSTRREQGGTGMGLSIVQAMLAAHGGSIRVAEAAHGAAFEIRIPLP